MVIRFGEPDENPESEGKREKRRNWSRSIWLIILVVLSVLIILEYSVVNFPGRYQAVLINDIGSVFILDTVKGHIWYSHKIRCTEIIYRGKLKAGEKVPGR